MRCVPQLEMQALLCLFPDAQADVADIVSEWSADELRQRQSGVNTNIGIGLLCHNISDVVVLGIKAVRHALGTRFAGCPATAARNAAGFS